ncbi:TIGR04076 family protein [Infirmifilum sp.]|uniref:TIGR04076 family protein n=1 Tax=Infirmifilum sp. TaxID=2856575 RepID=UPI003D12B888
MGSYKVQVTVKEVRGRCAAGYAPGDSFTAEGFYIAPGQSVRVCLHALGSMLTLLSPLLKGVPARQLGIDTEDDVGYAQCPDPGKPYTCRGTVAFELRREELKEEVSSLT